VNPSDPGYYTIGKVEALDWLDQDPEPSVRSLDPRPADAPEERKPLKALVTLAEAAGWAVRVGYSLGKARAVRRGTYKTVHTFGVWGSGPWRWCAMYEWSPDLSKPWEWDRTAIWSPSGKAVAPGLGSRFVDANITDLKEFLTMQGGVGAAWFKAVHARVQEQAEAQKAKAKAKPATKKTKEGSS
jgi:hypothetical protein